MSIFKTIFGNVSLSFSLSVKPDEVSLIITNFFLRFLSHGFNCPNSWIKCSGIRIHHFLSDWCFISTESKDTVITTISVVFDNVGISFKCWNLNGCFWVNCIDISVDNWFNIAPSTINLFVLVNDDCEDTLATVIEVSNGNFFRFMVESFTTLNCISVCCPLA